MIEVRLAKENDIPRIIELYAELNIPNSIAESDKKPSLMDYKRTLNEINSVPGYELLVAEDNKDVVLGTMMLLVMPNLAHPASPWALVENLIVDSKQQRRDIGEKLVDYAIRQARNAGCYKIIINTDTERVGTRQFYRSLGFESSDLVYSIYL